MANITIRNIPDDIIRKIKTLSKLEKRSINNEILIILEKGVSEEVVTFNKKRKRITKETQVEIWKKLSGKWEDFRSTEEIIDDIYSNRTKGREFEL